MKKAIILFLIAGLCINLSSCSSSQDISSADDHYLEGLEQGYEDVFLNLWRATASGDNMLDSGELWETEHFTITITSDKNEWRSNISIELITHNLSISECFDEQQMLFNVFSYDGSQFSGLLTDDLFYMYAQLEEITQHTAQATVGIDDTTKCIAILVAIDSCIYKATYNIA